MMEYGVMKSFCFPIAQHSNVPIFGIRFLGDHGEGEIPVPIPNTEVKSFSADGTAWVTVWESRTLPRLMLLLARGDLKARQKWRAFLFLDFIVNLFILFGKEAKEGNDIDP
jgi:hypothetical protein